MSEFKVVPNRCNCHPETCCCNPWAVVDQAGNVYATAYHQDKAQNMIDVLTGKVKVVIRDN